MAAYLGYTLRMKTLFRGSPVWLMKRIQEEEEDCSYIWFCYYQSSDWLIGPVVTPDK